MTFAITEWNLNPNRDWYIKISDIGTTTMQIDLYTTEADAIADSNKVALDVVSFGTGVEVTLVMEETGTPDISLFNSALTYHLKVTGVDSDSTKTFHLAPFIDLPDINNSIYRSEDLIQKKAINEINKHTHIAIKRDIGLADYDPTLQVGNVCRINSVRRNINVLATLEEVMIIGTRNALINQVESVEYTDLSYG